MEKGKRVETNVLLLQVLQTVKPNYDKKTKKKREDYGNHQKITNSHFLAIYSNCNYNQIPGTANCTTCTCTENCTTCTGRSQILV